MRLTVSPEARTHIVERHRYGAAQGTSEFPRTWTDDDIVAAVEAVANSPASKRVTLYAKVTLTGEARGHRLTVIVANNGQIVTGYPLKRR